MYLFQRIIVLLCLTVVTQGENLTICPRFCKCDSYFGLNRAQCSSARLISAEVDVPHQVQILDLSYNDITIVDRDCFNQFVYLKYLNLSNNAVHTLDLEAFLKLRRLMEIDLSYNRLEYLDERLFAGNRRLRKLNLEGNKFMSLSSKSLLNIPLLMTLSLKNSQVNQLYAELFSGLPHLVDLDLSKNLLNNFDVEDFRNLKSLKNLNLDENALKCDMDTKTKLRELEKRGVNVSMDGCSGEMKISQFQQETEMFEKMTLAENSSEEEEDQHTLNKLEQWRFNVDSEDESIEDDDDEEDDNDDPDVDSKENYFEIRKSSDWFRTAPDAGLCHKHYRKLCQDYRSCLQDLNKVWPEQRKFKDQCQFNDIKFAFFLGAAFGIATAVFIMACTLCIKRCLDIKKPAATSNDTIEDQDDSHSQPLARPTSQLPPQARRQPRRRTAPPPRPVVRYEGPVTENFISRLFGRPARRQYYRSINQNTATLIRRLSRSNLFNNRLSQHIHERQTSTEAQSSPEVHDDSTSVPSAPRPETPPPSYLDVVINKSGEGK